MWMRRLQYGDRHLIMCRQCQHSRLHQQIIAMPHNYLAGQQAEDPRHPRSQTMPHNYLHQSFLGQAGGCGIGGIRRSVPRGESHADFGESFWAPRGICFAATNSAAADNSSTAISAAAAGAAVSSFAAPAASGSCTGDGKGGNGGEIIGAGVVWGGANNNSASHSNSANEAAATDLGKFIAIGQRRGGC